MKKIKIRIGVFIIIVILLGITYSVPTITLIKRFSTVQIGSKISNIVINNNESIDVIDNIKMDISQHRQ